MSSCVGHGGSTAMECLEFLANGEFRQFSRMFSYLTSQHASGIRGDNGAIISACVETKRSKGCCFEDDFHYPTRYQTTIPRTAFDLAAKHKIDGHQELKSYDEILEWIGTGKGPVIVGMSWFDNLANSKGVVEKSHLSGRNAGGHCVLFAGYTQERNGKPMIDMINSHGKSWGEDGWAAWTPEAVEALCQAERNQNSIIGITDITGFDEARIVKVGSRV